LKPPATRKTRKRPQGFTLAELLIALAILGEIATFTIPKVLSSQQNGTKNAQAKETAAMIAGAYQQAQLQGIVTTSTRMSDLTPYMNFVAVDTTSSVDSFPPSVGSFSCNAAGCLRLHNGALLYLSPASFSTTSGATTVILDPDAQVTNQGDSLALYLYYNGRMATIGDVLGSSYDPSWFHW
jgi:prepilin-type N-terminal cleavage/methylation domain-containing protein